AALLQPLGSSQAPLLKLGTRILVRLPFHGPWSLAAHTCAAINNSAVEIDLTGQVCADSVGTRMISGFGGQLDFVRGANASEGGRSIMAVTSTARVSGQSASRIVPTLTEGAGVVTTRGDVRYVVTEYGVADLYGRSLSERAQALTHIAHPDFHEELRSAAEARGLRPLSVSPALAAPTPTR
ncbi:acetyl-CoA hydrolase/transferase C-terminal domain-containing protein, partial [Deinococcus radiophilus]